MSFKSTIRISKLQSKNKMIGKTFNPSGHTIKTLNERDNNFMYKFNNLSAKEQKKLCDELKETAKYCKGKGCSMPFSYNLLKLKGVL